MNYFDALLPHYRAFSSLRPSSLPSNANMENSQHESDSLSQEFSLVFIHQRDTSKETSHPESLLLQHELPSFLGSPARIILEKITDLITTPLKNSLSYVPKVIHMEISSQTSLEAILNHLKKKHFNLNKTLFFPLGTQSTKIFSANSSPLHAIHSTIQKTNTDQIDQTMISLLAIITNPPRYACISYHIFSITFL